MKLLTLVLVALLIAALYQLWIGPGGLPEVWDLEERLSTQRAENARLTERNASLAAEVRDLKEGSAAIEERARSELGMIHKDEVFYQIVDLRPQDPS
jgi:cell division protein FtsB